MESVKQRVKQSFCIPLRQNPAILLRKEFGYFTVKRELICIFHGILDLTTPSPSSQINFITVIIHNNRKTDISLKSHKISSIFDTKPIKTHLHHCILLYEPIVVATKCHHCGNQSSQEQECD